MSRKLSNSLSKARLNFFLKYGYFCKYCGNELWDLMRSLREAEEFEKFKEKFPYSYEDIDCRKFVIPPFHLATVDHVNSLYFGGKDTEKNQVPACKTCNCSKSYFNSEPSHFGSNRG